MSKTKVNRSSHGPPLTEPVCIYAAAWEALVIIYSINRSSHFVISSELLKDKSNDNHYPVFTPANK